MLRVFDQNYRYKVMVILLALATGLLASDLQAQGKKRSRGGKLGVMYYTMMFGHLHASPTPNSESITTIACGQPLRILQRRKGKMAGQVWVNAKAGNRKGYVLLKQLNLRKPDCFQDKYPAFFKSFKLDISELYYWGRLQDQYISGKSQVF